MTLVEKTTSSAVNGWPSDQTTPLRSRNVMILPSELMPPFSLLGTTVTSSGVASLCGPVFIRNAIVSDDMYATTVCVCKWGLSPAMSSAVAYRSVCGIV